MLATAWLCAAALGLAAGARSEPGGAPEHERFHVGTRAFDLTAQHISYESEGELYVARGGVQIAQEGRILTADWVAFSNTTRKGMAVGRVVVREGDDILHADALRFQVDELTGVVLRGSIASATRELDLSGEKIERLDEHRYRMRDARFTMCQCPEGKRDPWAVRSGKLDVEVGEYATARNSTIDILGVPVLWLPWLVYPVKTDRETGLLFPSVSTGSRTGLDVGLPFFWAAADPLNVTIAPHYVVKRGFKPELSLEYVIGQRSWGEAFGTFLWDDDQVDPSDPSTPFDDDRWAFDWLHDQDLPGGWRAKVDARAVSDNLYPFDFRELSPYRYDRHLDSLAFAENRLGARDQIGVSGELRIADDLQSPDDADRDETWLQRAPDVRVSGLPSGVLGSRAFWSFDARYTHFAALESVRDAYPGAALGPHDLFLDSGIDGIPNGFERDSTGAIVPGDAAGDDGSSEGDLTFEEGELLADRGHRVVLNPRLHLPLRVADAIELLPELGWHGTFYQSRERGTEMRNLFTGQLDVRTRLRRALTLPLTRQRATHLLEPSIGYTAISKAGQSDNPLFIPRSEILQARLRALEPSSLTRDPADRIDEVSAAHVSLGNRLYVADAQEGAPPRLLADATFSLWWDFAEDSVRNAFVDGALFPARHFRSRFDLGFDLDESEIDEALFDVGYADERGNDLSVGYRLVRDLPRFYEAFRFDEERFQDFSKNFGKIDQIDLYGRWTLRWGFSFTYRVAYSLEGTFSLRNQLGAEYVSRCKCWALRVELEDERSRGFQVNVAYRILGIGDDTVRPFSSRRLRAQDTIIGAR